MATAQKRGFRFPWGGDPRRERDSAPATTGGSHEPSLAERLGVIPDDLGRGPFDLSPSESEDGTAGHAETEGQEPPAEAPTADGMAVADPGDADAADTSDAHTRGADMSAAATSAEDGPATGAADAGPATSDVVPTASAAGQSQAAPSSAPPVATSSEDAAPTQSPAAASGAASAAPDEPSTAWPEADRRSKRATAAPAPATDAVPARSGKPNPLMAGLVRAMRDAAKTARDEAVAGLRADAAERSERIRAETTSQTVALRRQADADVAAIREWSKAEIAKVRDETEARIAARKQQLVGEIDDQAQRTEGVLARLSDAVQSYEAMTAAFFDALLAEGDPARLAGLAERMPTAPALDEFQADTSSAGAQPAHRQVRPKRSPRAATSTARGTGTTEGAVAADPAARMATPDPWTASEADVTVEASPDAVPDGVVHDDDAAAVLAGDGPPVTSSEAEALPPVVASDPDVLDPEAAAAAEAEALAGLEGQTQLIVSGLTGVAAIAGFKAALMRDDGVTAVSVNAGSDGDYLFTVTHGGEADVRHALREMDAFQTRLIADDGSTLVVVAQEAAA